MIHTVRDSYEFLGFSLDSYVFLGVPMNSFGFRGIPMDTYGFPEVLIGFYGFLYIMCTDNKGIIIRTGVTSARGWGDSMLFYGFIRML
jgi:hypothetical protein